MPNYQFAQVSSPGTHKDFVTEVNKWKYEAEGTLFRGMISPYVSEIKLYDVRVRPEIEKQVVRDLRLSHDNTLGTIAGWKTQLIRFFMRVALFFLPWQYVPREKGDCKYTMTGRWAYTFPLGRLPRKRVQVRTGNNREVL